MITCIWRKKCQKSAQYIFQAISPTGVCSEDAVFVLNYMLCPIFASFFLQEIKCKSNYKVLFVNLQFILRVFYYMHVF